MIKILKILLPIVLSITGCKLIENEPSINQYTLNPFFFPNGMISVEYDGWFFLPSMRSIEQNTILRMELLDVFSNGQLWSLEIDQIDVSLIENPVFLTIYMDILEIWVTFLLRRNLFIIDLNHLSFCLKKMVYKRFTL